MTELADLLTNEQAAALLGVKPNTLKVWRHKGKGPAFIKLGDTPQAPVRYLHATVADWLAAKTFASTSAYSPAALSTPRPHICTSGRTTR